VRRGERRRRQGCGQVTVIGLWLGLALLSGGCGDGETAGAEARVVWRLSEAERDARGLTLQSARVKLGSATRSAIRVGTPSMIEIEVRPTSGRLILSLGVPDKTPADGTVTFAVSVAVDGQWRQVLVDTIAPGPWEEHIVDLGESGGVTSRLRLQTLIDPDDADAPEEGLWGSVRILAD
jgi:hypothetical protein